MRPDVKEKMYECDKCSFRNTHLREFNDHCQRHESPNFKAKKCSFANCDFEHSNIIEMSKHHDRVHLSHPNYSNAHNRHLQEHIKSLRKGGHECLICGGVKKDLRMMEVHIAQLHGDHISAPFVTCLYCSFKTRHTFFLKQHVKVSSFSVCSRYNA